MKTKKKSRRSHNYRSSGSLFLFKNQIKSSENTFYNARPLTVSLRTVFHSFRFFLCIVITLQLLLSLLFYIIFVCLFLDFRAGPDVDERPENKHYETRGVVNWNDTTPQRLNISY